MLINANFNTSWVRIEFAEAIRGEKISLINLSTYYSFPNFSEQYITINKIRYDIPTGLYDLTDLNSYLKKQLPDPSKFEIKPNRQTLRCVLESSYDVEINEKIGKILGFDPGTYRNKEAQHIVNIMPINMIYVKVSFVGGSYTNGTIDSTVFAFFPKAGPGEKIIITPPHPIYLPLTQHNIPFLDISMTDQNGDLIDFRNENISITLDIQ